MAETKGQVKPCGCVVGYYDCGDCDLKRARRSWRNLTDQEKAYDRWIDPGYCKILDQREESTNVQP